MSSREAPAAATERAAHRGALAAPAGVESILRSVILSIALAWIVDLAAGGWFTDEQMFVVRPLIYTVACYAIFTYVLSVRTRTAVFGELGFIYLSLALAYTVLPGMTTLLLDMFFPLMVDGQNVIDLAPSARELGAHFWRHLLFIAGVAVGYLWVRGGPITPVPRADQAEERSNGPLIGMWIVLILISWFTIDMLSAPVATYLENYTRFDHLGWFERRIVYVCMTLKSGGYFVLLSLLFMQYRRWRGVILVVVPIICVYEGVFSFGQRIETLTVLLATVGFLHFRVAPVSLRKGAAYMVALAILFSGIGLFRASGFDLRITTAAATQEGGEQFAEFGAVYNTGFHLYSERAHGTLPPRPPLMFVSEVVALIPFVDHTTNNPMYWYARNYFSEAVVPPQTMGVIADSAIWGGEWDLLVRSLLNGALFAILTRWFLRNRDAWFATNSYVFAFSTCVLTLKYSVLYQVVPFARLILPVLIITALASRAIQARERLIARVRTTAA